MIVGGGLSPHWEVTVIWERSARGDGERHGGEQRKRKAPVLLGFVETVSLPRAPLLGDGSHLQNGGPPPLPKDNKR